ncbi:MAG TPA: F0F1 ATP synthase subunit B [Gaiellaceae bacterium]|nr:F0F1 ATP synthase subunit B [Gaiellaceae bacterium]
MVLAVSSPLTRLIPGLMIWTILFFLVVFFVLRKYAFSAIQKTLDDRREHIQKAIASADEARDEAQRLLEEHKKLIGEARSDAEGILAEARKTREAMEQRMRDETEKERQRRLEETRKEIAAETARALEQIRSEVADLTLEAASRVVGKTLDAQRDRELISEAIAGLDFSRLEESA